MKQAQEERELYQFLDEYHNKLLMITDVKIFRKRLLKIFRKQKNATIEEIEKTLKKYKSDIFKDDRAHLNVMRYLNQLKRGEE